jgi:SAM-dependent MidA family methyltransferase
MNPLEQKIAQRITEGGPIPFEIFMDMALYDPEYGYYASRVPRIGRQGDFYTSSHLHPVFGILIGKQIAEMWKIMGEPEEFTIVEMGAGEGFICNDMLGYLEGVGDKEHSAEDGAESRGPGAERAFYKTLRYVIVERNCLQRERQQELLKKYSDKVQWISDIRDAGRITGCICSNELLDAFPVHLLRMEDELKEVYVDHDGEAFTEKTGPLSTDAIARYFHHAAITLDAGYTTEINLRIREWLSDVDAVLERGFIFTIDYGYPAEEYYSEDRNRGTLMCYYHHQFHENPYAHIGEQDITAHVNFSSLKHWGEEKGIRTAGFCSQGTFLLALGIDEEIARLAETSKDYYFELGRVKKLFLPQGLGESHKVMIQHKGIDIPTLKGFSIRNQLRLL